MTTALRLRQAQLPLPKPAEQLGLPLDNADERLCGAPARAVYDLSQPARRFQGETFDARLDGARLTRQYDRVFAALAADRERWWTLRELADVAGGSEAGVSARLRDYRKEANGSHAIERRRRGEGRPGLFEYRLAPPKPKEAGQ